jgi:hypothetical protein
MIKKSLYPSSASRRVITEKNSGHSKQKSQSSKINFLSKLGFLNPTLYKGDVYFKLERNPYYSSGRNKLCKVLADLKFTNLVTRIRNFSYDEDKLADIDRRLGCIVRPELVGYLKDLDDPENSFYKQSKEIEDWNVSLFCYSVKSGKLIGELSELKWLLKYGAKIDEEYPHVAFSRKLNKWYGWSHRAMCSFGPGDMLFESDWTGGLSNEDVEKMPFRKRGEKVISNLQMARQAAINFSKYVG